MILGVDISTSVTGITLINKEGTLLVNKCVNTKNKKKYSSIFKVADAIAEALDEIKDVKFIFIEPPLLSFSARQSSAKTLSLLSKINGIVSYIVCKKYQLEPEYIETRTARKMCGITIERGSDVKKKVIEEVKKMEPNFVVEYTKKGKYKAGTSDRADSYVQAVAGLKKLRQQNVI